MASKRRWRFHIQFDTPDGPLEAQIEASTAQAACRRAFRQWHRERLIDRQPDTTLEGGFRGVTVRVLRRVH